MSCSTVVVTWVYEVIEPTADHPRYSWQNIPMDLHLHMTCDKVTRNPLKHQYASRSLNRMTPLIFGREPSVEIQLCRLCSYIKLNRSHKSACLAGRLSPPLVRSCGLQHSSRCEMICSESVLEWIPVMVSMEVSRSNGIPCPSQWCDRCEIRLQGNLAKSSQT